jgi:hypothetical protein
MVQTRLHKHSLSKKQQTVSSVASRASVRDPIDEFQEVYGSRAASAAFRQQLGSDFSRSGQIQPAIQAKPSFRGLSQELAPIQAKLTVGPANDRYEQEADRVARQVVQRIHAPVSNSSTQGSSVQRRQEQDELQKKAIAPIQRLGMSVEGGEVSTGLESEINRARGGGQPLDTGLQAKMGEAMGADFSGVKVHTDSQSDQLNQSIEAKAFTTGQDLFFRKGAYEPGSKGGQELIAHELTHVVQQNARIQTSRNLAQQQNPEDANKERISAASVNGLQTKPNKLSVVPQGSSVIKRDEAQPNLTPQAYLPPSEVANGMLPDDAQMVSINTRPLYDAINGAWWPRETRNDPSWVGWTQIANLTSQSFWIGNLRNATTGAGIRQDLAVEDISFPGGYLKSSIQIRATIKKVQFESADGVGVTQAGLGTSSAGSSSAVTTTNTTGVSGELSQGQPGQKAGSSASTATASTNTGQAAWLGSSTTATAATEGVRFKFDIDWNVIIRQNFTTGTGTMIFSLGIAGFLAYYVKEIPKQEVSATTTGAVVRFPKVRCTPG